MFYWILQNGVVNDKKYPAILNNNPRKAEGQHLHKYPKLKLDFCNYGLIFSIVFSKKYISLHCYILGTLPPDMYISYVWP